MPNSMKEKFPNVKGIIDYCFQNSSAFITGIAQIDVF